MADEREGCEREAGRDGHRGFLPASRIPLRRRASLVSAVTTGSKPVVNGPARPLLVLLAGYAAWTVIVLYVTAPVAPAQRAVLAGSLLAVGALVCGMGYLSSLRRGALRERQRSVERLLEERRRERQL